MRSCRIPPSRARIKPHLINCDLVIDSCSRDHPIYEFILGFVEFGNWDQVIGLVLVVVPANLLTSDRDPGAWYSRDASASFRVDLTTVPLTLGLSTVATYPARCNSLRQ